MQRRFAVAVVLMCLPLSGLAAQGWQMKPVDISTRWAKSVSPARALPEYPRPQMARTQWENLNGLWQYAIVPLDSAAPKKFDGDILVPYPIESALSGVKRRLQPTQTLWYRRVMPRPVLKAGERVLLHFGAVDWRATVTVNETEIGTHEGGYTSFSFDVTDALRAGSNTLTVKVFDPSDQGVNPYGKQTLNPGGIMYTPSSGIWQTVWLEVVPAVSIESLRLTPDVDRSELQIQVNAPKADGYTVEVVAMQGEKVAGKVTGKPNTPLVLGVRSPHLWSPDDPYLYQLTVRLVKGGAQVDRVSSYFGMRKIAIQNDSAGVPRIFLNNRFTYNLGTLDQGFWPEGLYTAPTDSALQFDIRAIKAMGFNTIRKHIKVEPARWYYHADRLGVLVWQDLIAPANDTPEARTVFEKESAEILAQLHNAPCITTWVVFNEGWGTYDQARLTAWVKSADPSRLVNGHSGVNLFREAPFEAEKKWPNADMTDIHNYPDPQMPDRVAGKAQVLGEFGGIGVNVAGHLWNDVVAGWGYGRTVNASTMKTQLATMVDSLKSFVAQGLSGSIYTQPFDVESEQNGVMTYDREVIKVPLPELRRIHEGLWPTTKNASTVAASVTATVADTVDPDYEAMLASYQSGKRDLTFLRRLALMADGRQDADAARRIASAYIKLLPDPLADRNLPFIIKFTSAKTDPGFAILRTNLSKIQDPTAAKAKMRGILYNEEVKPQLTNTPDWKAIDSTFQALDKAYGGIDAHRILSACVTFYGMKASSPQATGADRRNFIAVAKQYDARLPGGRYNSWAWLLFKSSSDTLELQAALAWSQKAVERSTGMDLAAAMDTHANVLYKLGRKEDALQWQSKAIAARPDDGELKAHLEKMKKGEPTWPVAP